MKVVGLFVVIVALAMVVVVVVGELVVVQKLSGNNSGGLGFSRHTAEISQDLCEITRHHSPLQLYTAGCLLPSLNGVVGCCVIG